ncbi:MAG: DNA polymerase IV [Candidatus Lokiarchaeota archaeon]|nr:DNA polymerase IV [Candidatus Lokiarchaeota archaeon]
MSRIVLHCDLDCFFAAVEIRDNPQLKGKPVIIGADPKEGKGRGVISTCNYEARKYGLHSAMPISQAYRRCPHGFYLKPNGNKYFKVSNEVMDILEKYSDNFQRVGTDEAYLELTEITKDFEEAEKITKEIQEEVLKKIGITISIGIAPTKSLAKIASDENKPNGITIVKPETVYEFLKDMDITRIPGIGKKTKVYFYKKGIKKIGDIINTPLPTMIKLFGKHGRWIWNVANGLDNRKVKEFHEERKSISAERTFFSDTDKFNEILSKFEDINKKIHKSILKHQITYKTITLKIRFEGFVTYTRSRTLPFHIQDEKYVLTIILELFKEFSNHKKKVRLVGIKLSNLERNQRARQTNLISFSYI